MRKNLILSMAALLSVSVLPVLTGCNKDVNEEPDPEPDSVIERPVITLTPGESDYTTLDFTVSAVNATDLAWMCLDADAQLPDVATVLSDGEHVDASSATEVTVSDLVSATDYKIVAAAANGEVLVDQVSVLELSTLSDLFADIEATDVLAWYYGYQEASDNDQIFLSLSNAEVDDYSAMPSGEGELLRLYLNTEKTDEENPVLAPGTYTLGESGMAETFTFDFDYSAFCLGTNDDDWMQIGYESGTVEVEFTDGVYSITANLVIADGEGSKVRGHYEGPLTIEDLTDGYLHFDTDMDEVMTGLSGGIYPGDGMYNNYTMTFYNCTLDADGFIIGAGFLFNTELFFTAGEEDYSGTYTPNHDWESGYRNFTYLPGDVMNMYGMYIPYGTYLSEYDDSGTLIRIGLVTDGELEITRSNGKVIMSGVFTTTKGHEIRVSFEGDEDVTDMTGGSYAPPFPMRTVQSLDLTDTGDVATPSAGTGWRALAE